MRLEEWLTREGKSVTGFSQEIGLARSTLLRVLADRRSPTFDVMCRIIEATRGEVQPNDFFPLDDLLSPPRSSSDVRGAS